VNFVFVPAVIDFGAKKACNSLEFIKGPLGYF